MLYILIMLFRVFGCILIDSSHCLTFHPKTKEKDKKMFAKRKTFWTTYNYVQIYPFSYTYSCCYQ